MVVCELLLDKRHASSLEIIAELVIILLLAVWTLLEGRTNVATVLVLLPTINLSITYDRSFRGMNNPSQEAYHDAVHLRDKANSMRMLRLA